MAKTEKDKGKSAKDKVDPRKSAKDKLTKGKGKKKTKARGKTRKTPKLVDATTPLAAELGADTPPEVREFLTPLARLWVGHEIVAVRLVESNYRHKGVLEISLSNGSRYHVIPMDGSARIGSSMATVRVEQMDDPAEGIWPDDPREEDPDGPPTGEHGARTAVASDVDEHGHPQ